MAELAPLKVVLPCGTHVTLGKGNVFAGIRETNPVFLRIVNLLEVRINLKIAVRRRMVPIVLSPLRDKVSGIHLDDAIEPWLAEYGFSNNSHEGFVLESA